MNTIKTFFVLFTFSAGVALADPGLARFFESENGVKLVQAAGASGYADDLARAVGISPSVFSGKTASERAQLVAKRLSSVNDPAVIKSVQSIAKQCGYSLSPSANGVSSQYSLTKLSANSAIGGARGIGNGERAQGASGGFAAPGTSKPAVSNAEVNAALSQAETATGQDLNWIVNAPLSNSEKVAALRAAPSTLRSGCQASKFGKEAQNNLAKFMSVESQGDAAVLNAYRASTKRKGDLAQAKINELCTKCNICLIQ